MMNSAVQTRWWHKVADPPENKVVCTLCPRECHIPNNKRGFCFVRANVDGELVLTTYGRSSGFCIDPIEKKPLNHFLPGTPVLSFGTAGCNLGCKFCQNWDISKSREMDRIADQASPKAIIDAAEAAGCRSVAFTYNDPVIWAEYAIDIAKVARERGIKTVAVTAGYIHPEARGEFYEWMDAANVDLKAFTETFYRKLTQTHLQPVLDTLEYLKQKTDVWFEITNLMIPDENDSPEETAEMCKWIVDHVGVDVPMHFTAFHPDFKMMDKPRTPQQTLIRAREQAIEAGIKYAYVGNVYDRQNQSTMCPSCGSMLIERDWYELGAYGLNGNRCGNCGEQIPGVFEEKRGNWGRKRVPVRIQSAGDDFVKITTGMSKSRQIKRRKENDIEVGNEQSPVAQRGTGENPSEQTTAVSQGVPPTPAEPKIDFSQSHVKAILAYCRVVVETVVRQERSKAILPSEIANAPAYGLFVSLKRTTDLRACRGRWGDAGATIGTLLTAVARDAATMDPRFPSIYAAELPYLSIEISLMHDPQEIQAAGEDRIKEVKIGRHGLVIQHPRGRGLLLPHVATEAGFDAKMFLDRLCQKAGLPLDTWRRDNRARLMTFRARLIGSDPPTPCLDAHSLDSTLLQSFLTVANLMLRDQQVDGEPDELLNQKHPEELGLYLGTESGLTAVAIGANHNLLELAQIAVKSLKNICAKRRTDVEPITRFSLLWEPIRLRRRDYPRRHGTLDRSAILARASNKKWALVVPGQAGRTDKIADALGSIKLTSQQWTDERARLTAFRVLNFESPQYPSGLTVRQPARAGQFYPADTEAMNQAIGDHLAQAGLAEQKPYRAVMLPHAGWRFCGDTLAKTIARVKLPQTVIVISPKHTAFGPRWSIPPHQRWNIPGASIPIATDLARIVLDRAPDFRCEPEAHRMEHGVEVLLPFLYHLNPQIQVLPMVMGQSPYEQTTVLANVLAGILSDRAKEPPLLIISSDMNHFASEAENRRLDRMAIDAMLTAQPKRLYDTCRENEISMCGVIPAVTIMQALLQDSHHTLELEFIDYSNSADVTDDMSQVVGYAGVVLS